MRRAIISLLFMGLVFYGCGSSGSVNTSDTSVNESQSNSNTSGSQQNTSGGSSQQATNKAPKANAGPDQSVGENETVILDGSKSSDQDGDQITYSWKQIAGVPVTLINPTSAKPTFTSPKVTTATLLTFELTVSDGSLTSKDSVNITINNTINEPPIADAGPDQNVTTGSIVLLDGIGSSDPNGDSLTYNWTFVSRPNGSSAVLTSADTDHPTFIPDVAGDYVIHLTVSDGVDISQADEVRITAVLPKKVTLKGSINALVRNGKVHYFGEIINETDTPVCFVEMAIDSIDSNGNLIDTDFTYITGSTMVAGGSANIYTDTCLRPGEYGGFEIWTNLTSIPASYKHTINYRTSDIAEPAVSSSEVVIDGSITESTLGGHLELLGFIKNLHPSITLTFVEITFVALNNGKVIDIASSYINGSSCEVNPGFTIDTCLAPGESKSFNVLFNLPPGDITSYYYKISYDVL